MSFPCIRSLLSTSIILSLLRTVLAIKITGAAGGLDAATGERPSRLEIHQLQESGPSWDLFILALSRFQNVNQSSPLSYYQIAGIHGYPTVPWDGVVGTGPLPGYCTHAATSFPTWHRPYLALFEILWTHAQDVANFFPLSQRKQYQDAAILLRLPYWDWAVDPSIPEIVTAPEVTVNTPEGRRTIPNPLYSYVFKPENGFPKEHPLARFHNTVRWWDDASEENRVDRANAALLANGASIASLTYRLFAEVTDYTTFSCTWPGGVLGTGNNIENIHNGIHNSLGGFGHMQYPEVAAFDPVFWLHHANVDRIFAMWQVLYPDSYIVPTPNTWGSYYVHPGTLDSAITPLAPFHSDNGLALFTSETVRGTRTFGYSYPEIPDWRMDSTSLATFVRNQINDKYNRENSTTNSRSKRRVATTDLVDGLGDMTFDVSRHMRVNNLDWQWSITVAIDRFAHDTSFSLHFFMGEPPVDTSTWSWAPNLVGTHGQFIAANVSLLYPDGVPGGQVEGEVSLTHALATSVAQGALIDLSPRRVVPFLQKTLSWRAQSPTGDEIHLSSLSGLYVTVSSSAVRPSKSRDRFPAYGARILQTGVTAGKPCGAQ